MEETRASWEKMENAGEMDLWERMEHCKRRKKCGEKMDYLFIHLGESMNTVPHYHKLCSLVSHIGGNCRGQHIWSAMDKPRPGKTTFMIMVSPLPGKYER